jgi:hypothetical protein
MSESSRPSQALAYRGQVQGVLDQHRQDVVGLRQENVTQRLATQQALPLDPRDQDARNALSNLDAADGLLNHADPDVAYVGHLP